MTPTLIGTDVNVAAGFLRKGKLVAIPTETVYGLAGNALDNDVVLNIFKMKERPSFDPLIVHIGNIDQLHLYAEEIPEVVLDLAKKFWPGPLTFLLKKKNIIPDLVTSGLDTVAIRIPDHPLTIELLNLLDFPLAAPSANPFGYISPTSARHVANQFTDKIPYILDGGPCRIGIESTIIGFENNRCVVYRLGGMTISEIENYTGKVQLSLTNSSDPRAPGMIKSHYAPNKPLYFGNLDELVPKYKNENAAVICMQLNGRIFPDNFKVIELSKSGDNDEAARELFSVMRLLDGDDVSCILAEPMPETGLGAAINDRLRRASVI